MDIPALAERYGLFGCHGIADFVTFMGTLDDADRALLFSVTKMLGVHSATADPLDFFSTMMVSQLRAPVFKDDGVTRLDEACMTVCQWWQDTGV